MNYRTGGNEHGAWIKHHKASFSLTCCCRRLFLCKIHCSYHMLLLKPMNLCSGCLKHSLDMLTQVYS